MLMTLGECKTFNGRKRTRRIFFLEICDIDKERLYAHYIISLKNLDRELHDMLNVVLVVHICVLLTLRYWKI